MPTAELHDDIAFNLALPLSERSQFFCHDERVLDLSKKVLINLPSIKAHALVATPCMRRMLQNEALLQFTVRHAKLGPALKPWGPMVFPSCLAAARHYFAAQVGAAA